MDTKMDVSRVLSVLNRLNELDPSSVRYMALFKALRSRLSTELADVADSKDSSPASNESLQGLKLYRLTQSENRDWDTYDSCVVAAESPEDAVRIHPEGTDVKEWNAPYSTWAYSSEAVRVDYIGKAAVGIPHGVVLASFNAG
jgi:hypothetical protein